MIDDLVWWTNNFPVQQ